MGPSSQSRAAGIPAAAYALSFAVLIVAVGLRFLLDPFLGDALALVTLFGAVAYAAWIVGYRAGIAAALLGYLACAYLFIPPRGRLGLDALDNQVGLAAYLFTCALVIVVAEVARRAHGRVREQHELLRVTLSSIGDAVISTDVDGRVTYLNGVAENLTGWTDREAQGVPLEEVFRIVNENTRQPVENPATKALREGKVVGLANHTVLIRKDGAECAIDDSAAPIRDEKGRVSGCVLIFRDVSEQRRLWYNARLLANIVESSEVPIISKSLDGTIQSWNAAAEELFGHTADEAIGRHISLLLPPERLQEEDKIIGTLQAGRRIEHFETERIRKDGERVLVSLTISPIRGDDGSVIGASKIVRDITRERRAEAEREKFITLVESSTDFIGICNLDGMPIFVNRAGLELVGLDDLDEARRTRVRDFFFPEDRPVIEEELFPKVLEQGHGEIEIRFRHFRTGEARWMMYKAITLNDRNGRPIAIGTVSQDITGRKQLEDNLRSLAADLSAADRRKDEFLATLAHELRSPLAPLSNVLEIWRSTTDSAVLARARDTMARQLNQMVRLVDDLLDLNRISHNRLELRRRRVALAEVIRQSVEACQPLLDASGHELRLRLPGEACYLDADPARLAQVFGNLLSNACKYTDPGGTITVTAERQDSEVLVSVKDTGAGISTDELDAIFDMFVQAGPSTSQHGLGIGLTLVKRLVGMHGGSIEARSAGKGLGSEFVVSLPLPP